MIIDKKIENNKEKYDINREEVKNYPLSSYEIDKY